VKHIPDVQSPLLVHAEPGPFGSDVGQSLAQLQEFLPLEQVPLPHGLAQTTQSQAGAMHSPLVPSTSAGIALNPGQHCGGLGMPVRLIETPSETHEPASAPFATHLPAQGAVWQRQSADSSPQSQCSLAAHCVSLWQPGTQRGVQSPGAAGSGAHTSLAGQSESLAQRVAASGLTRMEASYPIMTLASGPVMTAASRPALGDASLPAAADASRPETIEPSDSPESPVGWKHAASERAIASRARRVMGASGFVRNRE
jgi:hypothetical protein